MKQFRDTDYYVTENGDVYRKWSTGYKKLKPQINKGGYVQLTIYPNKKRTAFTVHRLVAECYISNPYNLPEVNHDDCNKTNNHVSNLYWCTHPENIKHAVKMNVIKSKKGIDNPNSKLTKEQVKWIRENYIPRHKEVSIRALSRKFQVSEFAIQAVINHKTYKNI